MITGLVLSAGGMFAAWEVGVWKVLRERFKPDLIAGASAGAWNGWSIAGGASIEDLERHWLDPELGRILGSYQLHSTGFLNSELLRKKARELYAQYRPEIPFGLTIVEVPRMRLRLVTNGEIQEAHLAATASIPGAFPPVRVDGRHYVDGGLMGALPLIAAEKMGASRVIALNCLNMLPYRIVHAFWRPLLPKPSKAMSVRIIEPSESLGAFRDAWVWSRDVIKRAIDLGERDGLRAVSSITM